MSLPIPSTLLALLQSGTSTICFCWLIERKDGVAMGFTDHDADIAFGGNIYVHSTSFVGSAMETQIGLAVSNMDVMGSFDPEVLISSNVVTDNDLECGRYDGAALTIYLVDWTNPTVNNVVRMCGTLGQVVIGDLAYQAEIRSLSQAFGQYIGALCSQKCRSDLFATGTGLESGCNFPKPDPIAATVASVTSRSEFAVSAVGSFPPGTKGSLSGGYFAEGTVTFGDGTTNAGLSMEIASSDEIINIVLYSPMPDDVSVGDTLMLQIGCDKTLAVCANNFNNVDNFRGEPYVPGTDVYFHVNSE